MHLKQAASSCGIILLLFFKMALVSITSPYDERRLWNSNHARENSKWSYVEPSRIFNVNHEIAQFCEFDNPLILASEM